MRILYTTLLLFIVSLTAMAQEAMWDVVHLKNGSVIKGVIIEQVIGQSIKLETRSKDLMVFRMDEVAKLTKERANGTPQSTAAPAINVPSNPEAGQGGPAVGDRFGGGIVFHVDEGSRTVWVAPPVDQAHQVMWGVDGTANAWSQQDGQANTAAIMAFYRTTRRGPEHTSACICDRLSYGGFDDWYLPAINELQTLYQQSSQVGGFVYGIYQSSTEESHQDFFGVYFKPARRLINNFHKDNPDFIVRCIRKQAY